LREARASACLDHPNIVRTFDLCEEGRLLYLVMEYVEGISLQALVGRHGPLDLTAACHYARQVAFGLQHAHDRGFVHRDVKPANLLLDRDGVVKLLDLGLVRSESEAASGLTRKLDNRSILGTADYVAPEQAVDSSGVDHRADLYSLGATLYFLLTGRTLFPEGRTAQKLVWQQVREPVPVDRLRPEVPPDLAGVVHTLLQKRPGDRYQTAGEVFLALEPWALGPVAPPDESLLGRPPVRRSGLSPARTTRTSGTAQVLSAALRGGGSGSGSRPAVGGNTPAPRPSLPDTPPQAPDGSEETGRALEQTIRTPGSAPRPAVPTPPPVRRPPPTWGATALVAGGLVAAAAAVCGLLVLVLKG
jgi:serine/threonine-protein kinase